MIFIINNEGTTTSAIYENVYQGSNNANRIVLLAPVSSATVPTVTFVSPKGQVIGPYAMTSYGDMNGTVLDKYGNAFSAWSLLVKYPITKYAGKVEIQFSLYFGNEEKLTTDKAFFEVIATPGASLSDEMGENYDKLLNHLASIKADSDQAIATAIKSIRFVSPDSLITPSAVEIYPSTLLSSGSNPDYKGDFNVSGMTEHIEATDEESFFLAFRRTSNINQDIGFTVDLGEEKEIGFVQLTGWANYLSTQFNILTSKDGAVFTQKDTITLPPVANGTQDIYRFNLKGESARYIRIIQPLQRGGMAFRFNIRGVEIFAQTFDGCLKMTHNNGVVNYIDTFDGELLHSKVSTLTEQAKECADYMKEQLDKEGQAGGVLLLEDINGVPKIPSVYIQQVDIKDYIEIADEAELSTINAQKGDVAVLISEIDNEKIVTKSWILLGLNEDSTRNWAVYGTSYATNAGNATYATSATNATHINGNFINKVTQDEYDSLTDKSGIYFVTVGE